jgi:putative transposase
VISKKKDQVEMTEDLKLIYRATTKKAAIEAFEDFKKKWSQKYAKEVQS